MNRNCKLTAVVVLVLTLSSLTFAQQPQTEQEKNVALMKHLYNEVFNKGNIALIDELISPDFREHEEFAGFPPDREGVKQFFIMFRNAFPDLTVTIEEIAAIGDKVWTYITLRGTHKGEFMGIPASDKKIEVKAFDLVRIVNGKATDHWGLTDAMTMMQQLGALPEPGVESSGN
jgi:steroid delta-isomerase-like uncharacterized protein